MSMHFVNGEDPDQTVKVKSDIHGPAGWLTNLFVFVCMATIFAFPIAFLARVGYELFLFGWKLIG